LDSIVHHRVSDSYVSLSLSSVQSMFPTIDSHTIAIAIAIASGRYYQMVTPFLVIPEFGKYCIFFLYNSRNPYHSYATKPNGRTRPNLAEGNLQKQIEKYRVSNQGKTIPYSKTCSTTHQPTE